jgi:hypothetical protein
MTDGRFLFSSNVLKISAFVDADQNGKFGSILKRRNWVGCYAREADLSEKMNEIVSRRQTFSLLGLATAALALAVPTTVLTVIPEEEAEAQTAGMVRRQGRRANRQERRQVRRTARAQRRAIRRGVVPGQ